MPAANDTLKEASSSHLGDFLKGLDKCTHDLLMISLNLEMNSDHTSSDKQNKIKTEILKRAVKGGAA
jgi:hypothetical protein